MTPNPSTVPGLQLALVTVLREYRAALQAGSALDTMRARHLSIAVLALRNVIHDLDPAADLMMLDCGIEKAPSLSTLDRAHLSQIRGAPQRPRPRPGALDDLTIPRL